VSWFRIRGLLYALSIDLQSLKFIYITFQEIDTTSQKKMPPIAKPIRELCSSFRHFPEFAGVFTGIATLNKEIYIYNIRRLGDAIRWKRPEKWTTSSWFRLHYHAPAHRSVSVKDFLAKSIPYTLLTWPQLILHVPSTEIGIEGLELL